MLTLARDGAPGVLVASFASRASLISTGEPISEGGMSSGVRVEIQDHQDETVFRGAARSLREMVDVGDHAGMTPATACALCRMFDAAARDVAQVTPRLRVSLLRVASTIQDRQSWTPRAWAVRGNPPMTTGRR